MPNEVTCASPEVVALISQAVKGSAMSPAKKRNEIERWKSLESCDTGAPLETKAKKGKGGGGKRAPSAYNIHVGECMKSGSTMKQCAASWKTKRTG